MNVKLQLEFIAIGAALSLAATTHAAPPSVPLTDCGSDAVLVGPTCVDKYEASVWLVPPTDGAGKNNKSLIGAIKRGEARLADLLAGNATQLGCEGRQAEYPPTFPITGNWTPDPASPLPPSPGVYAVSIPGVLPSACTSWFQAEQACRLSGKRLLSNQDWQAAAQGTPDPGTDNGTTDCNVVSLSEVNTGDRTNCVSSWGAHDMVGNLYEWVADWGDYPGPCSYWDTTFGDDFICYGGAGSHLPAARSRGGNFFSGSSGGVFASGVFVWPGSAPSSPDPFVGFRCGR